MQAIKKGVALFFILYSIQHSSLLRAQSALYDRFTFEMPFQEALMLLRNHKKTYQNINLGPGTIYAIRRASLNRKNNRLYSVTLTSKKTVNLKQASSYLEKSRSFFEKEGFEVVYADPHWDEPLLRDSQKPCIRMVQREKNLLIEMEPIGQGSIYNIYVTFYNYDWFVAKITGRNPL